MTAAVRFQRQTMPKQVGFWFGLAALLHALLLLVPAGDPRPVTAPGRALEIHLAPRKPPMLAPLLPAADTPQAAAPAEPGVAPPAAVAAAPPPAPPGAPAAAPRTPTAAALLGALGRSDWDSSATEQQRGLGQPWPRREVLPGAGAPQPAPNRFDGLLAPAEPEIVDRWLASDGSHNVVVRSTSGETYCGRAEAWNPMNPLYEPVMLWRTCGGGGKRRFEHLSSAKIEPPDPDPRAPRTR